MRKLLFVRHAAAEDMDVASQAGRTEYERLLTQAGIEKFRGAVNQLKLFHDDINLILHSPLARARQTAELLAEVYPGAEINSCEELTPGMQFNDLAEQLDAKKDSCIALVGHEPDFGQAISDAISLSGSARLDVKKGSAILVSFSDRVRQGEGCLDWSVTAEQLNAINSNS